MALGTLEPGDDPSTRPVPPPVTLSLAPKVEFQNRSGRQSPAAGQAPNLRPNLRPTNQLPPDNRGLPPSTPNPASKRQPMRIEGYNISGIPLTGRAPLDSETFALLTAANADFIAELIQGNTQIPGADMTGVGVALEEAVPE